MALCFRSFAGVGEFGDASRSDRERGCGDAVGSAWSGGCSFVALPLPRTFLQAGLQSCPPGDQDAASYAVDWNYWYPRGRSYDYSDTVKCRRLQPAHDAKGRPGWRHISCLVTMDDKSFSPGT